MRGVIGSNLSSYFFLHLAMSSVSVDRVAKYNTEIHGRIQQIEDQGMGLTHNRGIDIAEIQPSFFSSPDFLFSIFIPDIAASHHLQSLLS